MYLIFFIKYFKQNLQIIVQKENILLYYLFKMQGVILFLIFKSSFIYFIHICSQILFIFYILFVVFIPLQNF